MRNLPGDDPDATAQRRAAIVIPHYNDTERLGRCLEALWPQVIEGIEVIVVDNGSSQSLDGIRVRWPGVRILTEAQKGAAHARNRGVAETTADRLLFIDSDCVPADDWVGTGLEVADRADLVGGLVAVFDETPPPRSGAEAFETVFAFDFKSYIEKKGFSGSGNLVTWRRVFDRIGGFRAGMSEDLDWSHRATAAGFSLVYEERLRVTHPSRSDWPALRHKWRRVTEELWGLEGRGAGARARWAAKGLAMIPSILVHTPKVLRHPELDTRDKARALATLARLRLQRAVWMLRQAAGGTI